MNPKKDFHRSVKLGRSPVRHDARTLKLADYLPDVLPPAKMFVNYSTTVKDWGMLGNDTVGDCTCAGIGHLHMLRTALAGDPFVVPVADVLALYEAVTGEEGASYDPTTGVNDNGCVELDVLNYVRKAGSIGAFCAIDPSNLEHVKLSVDVLEGCYMGVGLPLSAQGQDIWDVTDPSLTSDAAPGSWGGHCMVVVGYDTSGVTFCTWGQIQKATWAWWRAYVNLKVGGEAYAIVSSDMFDGKVIAPDGFNIEQLDADVAALDAANEAAAAKAEAAHNAAAGGMPISGGPVPVGGRVQAPPRTTPAIPAAIPVGTTTVPTASRAP